VKRGVNGGFFTRIPTSEAVARVASVFLRVNGTTADDLLRAVMAFMPTLVELACNASQTDRDDHHGWVIQKAAQISSTRRRDFIEYVAEHGQRIGRLARCPPLVLFQDVLMELALEERSVNVFADRARMDYVADFQARLAVAIKDADALEAVVLAKDNAAVTERWLANLEPT
jgi:GntR family transcriptional regulator, transcriptional repressor for pyruvate dehydrogenase complex